MIFLGIDPGIAITGYAFLKKEGSRIDLLDYGVIETKKDIPEGQRLSLIFDSMTDLINRYRPDEIAVESLYFTNNQKTAFQVGQARGIVLLSCAKYGVEVFSYNPNQVKIAVGGYGRADKKQIQEMVKRLLGMKEIPKPDDASDAIAIALCHISSRKIRCKND